MPSNPATEIFPNLIRCCNRGIVVGIHCFETDEDDRGMR